MALRHVNLLTVAAVVTAVVLAWGYAALSPRFADPVVDVQDVADPAWRVEIETLPLSAALEEEEEDESAAE